jgi:8-oxo-dGTP diphosphatase
MDVGRFLAGIGALIWDQESDRYLLLRRSMEKDFAAGAWECVTGRLDQGEGFEQAVHREVKEEIGAEVMPLFILGTTHFYRGETIPDNELVGVVYCCRMRSWTQVIMSDEHDQYRWVTAEQAFELLRGNHPTEIWLQKVIKRAELMKRNLPSDLSNIFVKEGFELDVK